MSTVKNISNLVKSVERGVRSHAYGDVVEFDMNVFKYFLQAGGFTARVLDIAKNDLIAMAGSKWVNLNDVQSDKFVRMIKGWTQLGFKVYDRCEEENLFNFKNSKEVTIEDALSTNLIVYCGALLALAEDKSNLRFGVINNAIPKLFRDVKDLLVQMSQPLSLEEFKALEPKDKVRYSLAQEAMHAMLDRLLGFVEMAESIVWSMMDLSAEELMATDMFRDKFGMYDGVEIFETVGPFEMDFRAEKLIQSFKESNEFFLRRLQSRKEQAA